MVHSLRKLRSTVKLCWCMAMARTFGTYLHSVGGLEFNYAVYEWHGETWVIPTSPYLKD